LTKTQLRDATTKQRKNFFFIQKCIVNVKVCKKEKRKYFGIKQWLVITTVKPKCSRFLKNPKKATKTSLNMRKIHRKRAIRRASTQAPADCFFTADFLHPEGRFCLAPSWGFEEGNKQPLHYILIFRKAP